MTSKNNIPDLNGLDDLRKIAPTLSKIEKINPFIVPDGYFDRLPTEIQSKCVNEKTEPSWKRLMDIVLKPQYSIAVSAALVVIVLISYLLLRREPSVEKISQNNENIINKSMEKLPSDKISSSDKITMKESYKQSDDMQPYYMNSSYFVYSSDTNVIPYYLKYLPDHSVTENTIQESYYSHSYIAEENAYVMPNKTQDNINSTAIITEQSANGNNTENVYVSSKVSKQYQDINKDNNTYTAAISLEKETPYVNLGSDICSSKNFILNAGNSKLECNYLWSTGETTQTIKISSSGIYSVTVSFKANKDYYDRDTVRVKIIPDPVVDLGPFKTICKDEPAVLDATNSNDNYTYYWYPEGETTSKITTNKAGFHIVGVTGCNTIYDTIFIAVENCELTIPNVFTPNGDGSNDFFQILNIEKYPNSELIIYNRKGIKVYENLNYQNNWNGENNPDGVYWYFLTVSDGTKKQGVVTVKR